MENCIFCKILADLSPADKIHESEHVLVIEDKHPQAPKHYLVIPKKHVTNMLSVGEEDGKFLWEAMFAAVREVVKKKKSLGEQGFRTVLNTGVYGGQTVNHMHLHILGGRHMSWPPG